jgi:hypothetical protein
MNQGSDNKKERKSMLGQVVHVLRNTPDQPDSSALEADVLEAISTPDTVEEVTPTQEEELVGLCIKIPKSMRHRWKLGATREGISVTQAIIEALDKRFP